eukprot:COSAG01_NODE_2510_length_7546_cov_498.494427_2_plen_149_part_00
MFRAGATHASQPDFRCKNFTRRWFFAAGISVFSKGHGTMTVKDHNSGAALLTATIPLTPGPLVVVIKDSWPPSTAKNIETIAASFVPPNNGSAVRLFNLAEDINVASLQTGSGDHLASGIIASTRWAAPGHRWRPHSRPSWRWPMESR